MYEGSNHPENDDELEDDVPELDDFSSSSEKNYSFDSHYSSNSCCDDPCEESSCDSYSGVDAEKVNSICSWLFFDVLAHIFITIIFYILYVQDIGPPQYYIHDSVVGLSTLSHVF